MSDDESASLKKKWSLDQQSFDGLLAWLDPDCEVAGRRYQEIRVRLMKIFVRRGCYVAEELADETINRVARKLPEIEKGYVGDPALYFCGVARLVFKEWIPKPVPNPPPIPAPDPPEVLELYDRCLTTCLDLLNSGDHGIIVDYFKDKGRAKIESHNAMAAKLRISINALRTRAHRIKKTLKECVIKCIKRNEE